MVVDLNFKELGEYSGAPLIIIHGLFGSLDNWITLGKRFSETRKVYLVDQRNHGKSPHVDGFDYQLMAADLIRFMDQNQIQNADLIGHSMGGKTLMQLAVSAPEYINKAIIADIGPKYYPPHHQKILAGLRAVVPAEISSRTEADKNISPIITDFGTRQFLLKNLSRDPIAGFKWKMNLDVIAENIENVGAQIEGDSEVPLYFIGGEKSDYIQEDDIEGIQEQFVNSRFGEVPNAGHWIHAENPDAFFDMVSAFLDE